MKKVTGGALPAQTWKTFMQAAHKGLPAVGLPMAGPVPPVSIEGPSTGGG
jgi:penicillin-binding protein 1A